jgi:alpha-tubulin suppressor-like RCC1 family protein
VRTRAAFLLLAALLAGCDGVGPGTIDRAVTRPVVAAGGMRLAAISSGFFHTCGLDPSGRAFCWGDNEYRQLGVDDPGRVCDFQASTCHFSPVAVSTALRFEAISAGVTHTCALTAEGEAFCWGGGYDGGRGILGGGSRARSAQPVVVSGGHRFRMISVGGRLTCGVTEDDRALCWGFGGHVGDGSSADALAPAEVAGDHRFRAVTAGDTHACGVTTEGAALCWGSNQFGELGTGTVGPAFGNAPSAVAPVAVASDLRFTEISVGGQYACARTAEGAGHCWGRNHVGQLGTGAPGPDQTRPRAVTGGTGYDRIAAGSVTTCGLKADGLALCWGGNWFGALGDGGDTASGSGGERGAPHPVRTDERFTEISPGGSHTCALALDGRAWCWGDRYRGQLGAG